MGGEGWRWGPLLSGLSCVPGDEHTAGSVRAEVWGQESDGRRHGLDTNWIFGQVVRTLGNSVFSSVKWGCRYVLCLPQEIVLRV